MKKRKSNKIYAIIQVILIIGLVVFLAYEIIYQDALGIMQENNPIKSVSLEPTFSETSDNIENVVSENIDVTLNDIDLETEKAEKLEFKYYYNQLDKNAKIIYEGLENNINNMQTGNYKIDFEKQFNELLHEEDGEEKLNIAFQSAWNAFTYDYVEVFYIDVTKLILTTQTTSIGSFATHRVYIANEENKTYLSENFSDTEKIITEKANLSKLRKQVVEILESYSKYEQVKYLHDWMINNISYDTTVSEPEIYNIYGALRKGVAVCEGYARAFKYILDGLNIPCVIVSGTATNSLGESESHAWNYVQLDGKWYAIDVTWDDPVITNGGNLTNESRYRYFLKGSNEFLKAHKENGELSENSMKFRFPIIEQENYKIEGLIY